MTRSVWKGPFVDGYLLKKAEAARESGRKDIIKMTLDHQLFGDGVDAAAQQARSMPLTPAELTEYMDTIVDSEIMQSQPEAMMTWVTAAQPEAVEPAGAVSESAETPVADGVEPEPAGEATSEPEEAP